MPHTASQTFLRELDKKLWNAADKLRSNLAAAVYKHAVLGLIFLNYVSDSFAQRQAEIEEQLRDPESDFHLSPADYGTFAKYDEAIAAELEERDDYIEKNVFWVPALRSDDIPVVSRTRVATGVSPLPNLAGLIDLIATIPFQHADLHAKDILGHNTNSPQSNSSSASLGDLCAFAVNSLLPRMATGMSPLPDTFTRDPHPDLRADFVMALPSAAARSHPRSHPADRPNGRINPPFNIKEWWDGKLEGDARWNRSEAELASHAQFYKNRGKNGTPPQGNANFAWVQHMLHHLAPNGSMALLHANGSMSSNSCGEGDIRRALIEADLVECMVALPGQLFTNTQIPACIWFLTKNKAKRSRPGAAALRDRRGETLFTHALNLKSFIDRVSHNSSKN